MSGVGYAKRGAARVRIATNALAVANVAKKPGKAVHCDCRANTNHIQAAKTKAGRGALAKSAADGRRKKQKVSRETRESSMGGGGRTLQRGN